MMPSLWHNNQPYDWILIIGSVQHTTAWDFLPEQPTSPLTAAALLSGGDVKGVLRERKLHYLPRARCRYIGTARVPQVSYIPFCVCVWGGGDAVREKGGGRGRGGFIVIFLMRQSV